jgi:hypothetical protein
MLCRLRLRIRWRWTRKRTRTGRRRRKQEKKRDKKKKILRWRKNDKQEENKIKKKQETNKKDFFSVALQSFLDPDRLTYRRFLELFRHMVGLLGRVISPSQGLYLHRTTQHRKTRTNIHALSGIRTHDPSNQPVKTHASDRTATVTGKKEITMKKRRK